MYLYLLRHGIAVDLDPLTLDSSANDESRPLTKIGRKKISQVADFLGKSRLSFDLIMTSPLVRARETADILMDKHLSPQLVISPNLAPAGTIQSWLAEWESQTHNFATDSIALVGHEPNLSEWAELLIFGKISHQLILKKGGIIGLKFSEDCISIGTAKLHCLIPPKYSCIIDKTPTSSRSRGSN
jgi:phosphohistidine phosphatase